MAGFYDRLSLRRWHIPPRQAYDPHMAAFEKGVSGYVRCFVLPSAICHLLRNAALLAWAGFLWMEGG